MEDGVEMHCAFVRCYAPARPGWHLVFVQWTPAHDAPARAEPAAAAQTQVPVGVSCVVPAEKPPGR
jgi:hypothetical protein